VHWPTSSIHLYIEPENLIEICITQLFPSALRVWHRLLSLHLEERSADGDTNEEIDSFEINRALSMQITLRNLNSEAVKDSATNHILWLEFLPDGPCYDWTII